MNKPLSRPTAGESTDDKVSASALVVLMGRASGEPSVILTVADDGTIRSTRF